MTPREQEILAIIENDPLISQEELAYDLGITRSGVAAHIHNLIKKGYIKGRGYVLNSGRFVSVIGGINMDVMGISHDELILDNSNPGHINNTLGGAGRNIAQTLTQLDVSNYFISVYGNDLNGETFLEEARKIHMNTSNCELIADVSTSSYVYIVDTDGRRIVGVDDMAIYDKITPQFLEKYLDRINNSEYCIIDTNIPKASIEYLYAKVKVPIIAKTVSLNKNHRLINGIEKLNYLITTPHELLQILAESNHKFNHIQDGVDYLLDIGLKNVVIFSIKDGLYFKNKETEYRLKKEVNAENTNGAAATFTGALVWSLINNRSIKKSLEFAYVAAITSVESSDSVNPNLSVDYLEKVYPTVFGRQVM